MSETTTAVPAIGQPWAEQGGIYIGSRLKNGEVHHIVIPGGVEHDIKTSHNNAAERIAAKGEINGFSDWHHGSQEDLMLAYINAREHFHRKGFESIQITATPYGEYDAWYVAFESGHTVIDGRTNEFRVRPFRSIIHSAL